MDNSEFSLVYKDDEYELGQMDGIPCLVAGGRRFKLTCHPYEPCLYITDEAGRMTIVHNSFDPSVVLELVHEGRTLRSITGRCYGARDFCRMVEFAAGKGEMGIDDAEKVFGKKTSAGVIKDDDPFLDLIRRYPDAVPEYCLVSGSEGGREAHRKALEVACRSLMAGDEETDGWNYDLSKAEIIAKLSVRKLLTAEEIPGRLTYRRAFLKPPYGCNYTEADFDKVNATLFPRGTDALEIYEWSNDWSAYFDDGHEWWGTLCLSIYDRRLKRFVIILASATD